MLSGRSSPQLSAALLGLLLTVGCGTAPFPSTAQGTSSSASITAVTSPPPTVTPRPTPARAAARPSPSPSPVVVARGNGELTLVPGRSAVVGKGALQTYSLAVEGGLGIEVAAVTRQVERTLADPRSWTSGGRRSLARVDGPADVRIVLVSPRTTDRLCAPLQTVGRFSCANGDRAVLNAGRWLTGAQAYPGRLDDYRDYLVNHEVGHVLGFGHVGCPGRGQVAPVMLQQTLGLEGCVAGPWPYP